MHSMSVPRAASTPVVLPLPKAALAVYYFVGTDQGAVSVSGHNMYIHEFVHDARHFLGFPCH